MPYIITTCIYILYTILYTIHRQKAKKFQDVYIFMYCVAKTGMEQGKVSSVCRPAVSQPCFKYSFILSNVNLNYIDIVL